MFTGIIQSIGEIISIQPLAGDVRLKIATGDLPMDTTAVGDSIAVNGVCLTAIECGIGFFYADASNETLARTTLQRMSAHQPVNLELALTPTTRLGGHFVSGHVDGIGTVLESYQDARSVRFRLKAPDPLARYMAEKGSICIDGISLTINDVDGAVFGVNIVPHTLRATTLGTTRIGDQVNLEVDLLARYLERLMLGERAADSAGAVTLELLKNSGFIR